MLVSLSLSFICLIPTSRRILDKLDGVRFLFIVHVMEKVQKKAQFSFLWAKESFYYEIVLQGIQPCFLQS